MQDQLLKLDYSVRDDVIIKNLGHAFKCQRCGCDSKTTLCPECEPYMQRSASKSMFAGCFTTISVRGCDIYRNDQYLQTEINHFRAELVAKVLRKKIAPTNIQNLATIRGIRKR